MSYDTFVHRHQKVSKSVWARRGAIEVQRWDRCTKGVPFPAGGGIWGGGCTPSPKFLNFSFEIAFWYILSGNAAFCQELLAAYSDYINNMLAGQANMLKRANLHGNEIKKSLFATWQIQPGRQHKMMTDLTSCPFTDIVHITIHTCIVMPTETKHWRLSPHIPLQTSSPAAAAAIGNTDSKLATATYN